MGTLTWATGLSRPLALAIKIFQDAAHQNVLPWSSKPACDVALLHGNRRCEITPAVLPCHAPLSCSQRPARRRMPALFDSPRFARFTLLAPGVLVLAMGLLSGGFSVQEWWD